MHRVGSRRRTLLTALAIVCCSAIPAACADGTGSAPASTTATVTTAATTAATTAGSTGAALSTAAATTTTAAPVVPRFDGPGPAPVGVRDLTVAGRPVTVWYPAAAPTAAPASYDLRDALPAAERPKLEALTGTTVAMAAGRDAPVATGGERAGLVVFSHGLAGYATQSSFLTVGLASWGYVVVSPEHRSRNLSAVLAGSFGSIGQPSDVDDLLAMIDAWTRPGSDVPGAALVDPARVAVVGHSAGGSAAIRAAADPRVRTYVAMAAPVAQSPPPSVPSLLIAGTDDAIAPVDRVRAAARALPAPRRYAEMTGVTHLGFMDICTVARDQGGVLAAAERAGVAVNPLVGRLFADGCDDKYPPVTRAWPAIQHLVVAHLRSVFTGTPTALGARGGLDRDDVRVDEVLR